MRKEYKTYCQPITEGTHREQFRELTSCFWFHMTNSANSDGRWPPPPAVTCVFNRQWVRREIEATKSVLAEMRQAIAGIPLPPEPDLSLVRADCPEYGYYITDKDIYDLPRLNFYELQHALYAAWRWYDHHQGEERAKGPERVLAIYEEYRIPGICHFKTPELKLD